MRAPMPPLNILPVAPTSAAAAAQLRNTLNRSITRAAVATAVVASSVAAVVRQLPDE